MGQPALGTEFQTLNTPLGQLHCDDA